MCVCERKGREGKEGGKGRDVLFGLVWGTGMVRLVGG